MSVRQTEGGGVSRGVRVVRLRALRERMDDAFVFVDGLIGRAGADPERLTSRIVWNWRNVARHSHGRVAAANWNHRARTCNVDVCANTSAPTHSCGLFATECESVPTK